MSASLDMLIESDTLKTRRLTYGVATWLPLTTTEIIDANKTQMCTFPHTCPVSLSVCPICGPVKPIIVNLNRLKIVNSEVTNFTGSTQPNCH